MVGSLSNKLMNIQGVGLGFPQVGSGDMYNNRSTPAGPVQIFEYPLSDRTSLYEALDLGITVIDMKWHPWDVLAMILYGLSER